MRTSLVIAIATTFCESQNQRVEYGVTHSFFFFLFSSAIDRFRSMINRLFRILIIAASLLFIIYQCGMMLHTTDLRKI